jgi:hypothetical protein
MDSHTYTVHVHVERTETGLAEKTPPFLVLCMVTFSMHGTNGIGMDLLIAARHLGTDSRTWRADLAHWGKMPVRAPHCTRVCPEDLSRRPLAGIVARTMAVWTGCFALRCFEPVVKEGGGPRRKFPGVGTTLGRRWLVG